MKIVLQRPKNYQTITGLDTGSLINLMEKKLNKHCDFEIGGPNIIITIHNWQKSDAKKIDGIKAELSKKNIILKLD